MNYNGCIVLRDYGTLNYTVFSSRMFVIRGYQRSLMLWEVLGRFGFYVVVTAQ